MTGRGSWLSCLGRMTSSFRLRSPALPYSTSVSTDILSASAGGNRWASKLRQENSAANATTGTTTYLDMAVLQGHGWDGFGKPSYEERRRLGKRFANLVKELGTLFPRVPLL